MTDQQQNGAATPQLSAGRELDALVAEKVMGCTLRWDTWRGTGERYPHCACTDGAGPHSCGDEVWHEELAYYSTEIAAAWTVAEHMRSNLRSVQVCAALGGWWAHISHASEFADTAPHAICLAALAAVASLATPETNPEIASRPSEPHE